MIKRSDCKKILLAALGVFGLAVSQANAHPHVFVEASIEIVRNDKGEFSELRQVWRFDELFSSTLLLDFDKNASGKLEAEEISEITSVVAKSILEYDFYTAIRSGKDVVEFYPPDGIGGYMEGGQMIMFLSVEPAKPYKFGNEPLRVSASDTSYYVAFDMKDENITVSGPKADACTTEVTHPDFDKLYAENEQLLSDAFSDSVEDPQLSLGDEFYSWASISCT